MDYSSLFSSDMALFGAFLLGITLSFNPCMLAIIPLLSGAASRNKLSLSVLVHLGFVAGFVLVLAILGLVAGTAVGILESSKDWWTFSLGLIYIVIGWRLTGRPWPWRNRIWLFYLPPVGGSGEWN